MLLAGIQGFTPSDNRSSTLRAYGVVVLTSACYKCRGRKGAEDAEKNTKNSAPSTSLQHLIKWCFTFSGKCKSCQSTPFNFAWYFQEKY